MIKKINGETWKPLKFEGSESLRNKYALSSQGRAASYQKDLHEDGKILEGSVTSGYRTLNFRVGDRSNTIYLHREIARIFHKKPSSRHKFVIHNNYDKSDNTIKNLRWATQKESLDHQQKSPKRVAYKKIQSSRTKGLKLNASQVKAIKSALNNPKRKLTQRQIAEKYNISHMTIFRIKKGENWASV